jgi:small neutral amino acid transporter SnatA (MarC family)
LTFNTPIHIVQLIFGFFMLYAAIKMIISGVQHYMK